MSIEQRVVARVKTAGGSDFSVFIRNPNPRQAFQEAVQDAQYKSGHGGYSGTIAEKDGFKIRQQTPMSRPAANAYINKDIDRNDKWGPAFAIPIGDVKVGKPRKIKLIVEALNKWDVGQNAIDDATKKFQAIEKTHWTIKVLSIKEIPLKGKLRATTKPFGKESGFQWLQGDGRSSGKVYKSKKEAVDTFKTMDPRIPKKGDVWTLIESKTVAALEITGVAVQTYEVILEGTPEASVGSIVGWMFYGIASS